MSIKEGVTRASAGAATGSDFADFLLGTPSTSSIAFGNADKYLRAFSSDAYFTDDWRFSPMFTMQIGARWEYETPPTEEGDTGDSRSAALSEIDGNLELVEERMEIAGQAAIVSGGASGLGRATAGALRQPAAGAALCPRPGRPGIGADASRARAPGSCRARRCDRPSFAHARSQLCAPGPMRPYWSGPYAAVCRRG